MPWEGVTVSEQRRNFIRDYVAGVYSRVELAQAFSISRKTAYKWIARFKQEGNDGLEERSRRPHRCPWQTDASVAQEIVRLRKARPRRGPKKLLKDLQKRHRGGKLPAISTIAHILSREGLAKKPRRHRRPHPGCPKSGATAPMLFPAEN
jgi:putative transposase